ncbi:hypothetical protein [Bacillus xiamenensis]|uniref:hypothetical protein n=1 Tax=Bacillus xiamenensis TaxID=1178537 RepID=UPI00028BFF99|nr:hypothetical protein [Bacillus xiamenensis]EKF33730.1 hypothetical protein BA1_18507 [Bacillus xiamenensis]MCW1838436.1 hypothetical protein [Bacillus xiamenensis]
MNTILVELVNKDFDWNIVVNLIGACGVVLGAISGAYLYRKQKNTEWTEKSLQSVYAPLYMLVCGQESFRELLLDHEKNKFVNSPILSWEDNKKNEGVIHRNKFIEAFDKTNYGLASNKLLMLIGEYRVLVKLEEITPENHPDYDKITRRKVDVEIELVREIVREYQRLRQKLKIENDTPVEKFKIFE